MYGLSERSYEELIQILDSVPEVEEVLIYGSRARGNYDHASDIDLSLIGRNLTKRSLRMLNDKLYDSHIPYFFDTHIFANVQNPKFKANVLRDGRLLYKRGESQSPKQLK